MIVLDASIAGPLVLRDERPLPAWMEARLAASTLLVPVNWSLECMSMLHVAAIRRRIDRDLRRGATIRLSRLPVEIDGDSFLRAWTDTSRLSDEHGLTIYDAGYLELAIRRGAALASLDTKLLDAARSCGVEVLTY